MCRSISANEKIKAVAIGGCASKVGKMTIKPFISVHRVDEKGGFPLLCSQSFGFLEDCIASIEFMYFAKKPTILACDNKSLIILEFLDNKLEIMSTVEMHDRNFFIYL